MYKKLNHDISYAHSAQSSLGRTIIRCLENATGRSALLSRSPNLRTNMHSIQSFWHSIMEGYGVTIDVMQGELGDIPVDQPLIVVANHPYGILDGLVMGSILAQSGANFKIVANYLGHRKVDGWVFYVKNCCLRLLLILILQLGLACRSASETDGRRYGCVLTLPGTAGEQPRAPRFLVPWVPLGSPGVRWGLLGPWGPQETPPSTYIQGGPGGPSGTNFILFYVNFVDVY